MSELPIEEYFKYHPPVTDERKAKHNAINSIDAIGSAIVRYERHGKPIPQEWWNELEERCNY